MNRATIILGHGSGIASLRWRIKIDRRWAWLPWPKREVIIIERVELFPGRRLGAWPPMP